MKRQRSRNRGGGGKPQQNANRAFESNGPDGVKIRGAAQHVFEKYQQLARDALTAGDRVLAESYQQHAEHYFRVLRAVQPQRSAQDIIGRDAFASGFDIDFEDEGGGEAEAPEAAEAEGERGGEWRSENRYEGRPRDERQRDRGFNRDDRQRGDRNERYRDDRFRDDRARDDRQRDERRDERQRDDRPRDDRPRDERPRDERPRDERPRDERFRDERSRDDRPPREDRYRDERPREDRMRDEGGRDERQGEGRRERPRYDRGGERASDPLAVVEPQASPLTGESEAAASPMLRSQDGGISEAPAFLQARPEQPRPEQPRPEAVAEEGEAKPRARRRRAPRSFEAGAADESPAPAAEEA